MTIDITSFFFNSSIEGATATAAWGTSVGQNQSKECRIEDEKPGVLELLTGMLYKSISDRSRLDVSSGSSNREVLMFSQFDKVYINGVHLEDQSFVLLLVRENTDSHNGRLIVSYPPYALLDEVPVNDMAIKEMASAIGCTENGCWFVHDISVRNQDELHFSAVVVNKDKPMVYQGKSRDRSKAWAELVEDKRAYTLEELGAILHDMYTNAEPGKQVAMLYIFVFTYGEHLVDIYKSSELVQAAGIKDSFSTEIDKAYNIYRYAAKKRLNLFRYSSSVGNPPSALQIIYFGTPGSGKSHTVKDIVEPYHEDTFRTTFHPDTDYASFVGAYKPVKEGNSLTYEFIPQAFTDAYVAAWKDTSKPVYLVIEEINRGNCAQIFGDLFQLLDRGDDGKSEYTVKADKDLCKYLESDKGLGAGHDGIKDGELCLPSNLRIYATMNTSDQSLFPMDSAFKRRWNWVYVPIDPDNAKSQFIITIADKKYAWKDFLIAANEHIKDVSESEDKQMGNFFIKEDIGKDEFVSKVMFYLWSEVCKDEYHARSFFHYKDGNNDEFSFNELFQKDENGVKKDVALLQGFMNFLNVPEQ